MPTQNRRDRKPPGTPNTHPGKEGKGGGMGPAVEDTRELLVKCVRSHSHTNRTLDSLNNVDRPPTPAPSGTDADAANSNK